MKRYKYPRTYHLPFSMGRSSDDKVFEDYLKYFINQQVVITEKMDGENTTIYKDFCHARSIDSAHMDYHSWLLSYIRNFQYMLEEDERICGEYLYAKHSISYDKLPTYFMVFSIWHGDNCLPWDETEERCKELGLVTVPLLYKGLYNTDAIHSAIKDVEQRSGEGIVMRLQNGFDYSSFKTSVVKYVRKDHVQTDQHWSHQVVVPNELA